MSSVGDIFNMDLLASLTERLAQAERERDAALAKAEAADECAEALKVDAMAWRETANSVADSACELADLRARIEALADEWEKYQSMNCYQARQELRALLKPAKPKTALDVLAEVESMAVAELSQNEEPLRVAMAKLRKILESASPAP